MKSFGLLKMAVIVLGTGALLLIAPQARAQAEVAPDHFDGTDSWAVALAAKDAAKSKYPPAISAANQNKQARVTSAQNRGGSGKQQAELVAVQDKRRVSSSKSNKQ